MLFSSKFVKTTSLKNLVPQSMLTYCTEFYGYFTCETLAVGIECLKIDAVKDQVLFLVEVKSEEHFDCGRSSEYRVHGHATS